MRQNRNSDILVSCQGKHEICYQNHCNSLTTNKEHCYVLIFNSSVDCDLFISHFWFVWRYVKLLCIKFSVVWDPTLFG